VIITVMGTGRMYTPIRKILSNTLVFTNPQEKKDELCYIERRIDTLMKAESKLSHQLEKQSAYIKDMLILKLLFGYQSSNELEKKQLDAPHDWKWLTVLSLQIDSPEVKQYNEKDQNLIL